MKKNRHKKLHHMIWQLSLGRTSEQEVMKFSRSITVEDLICEDMILYQANDDPTIKRISRYLAYKIPKSSIDLEMLLDYAFNIDKNMRSFAQELVLKHFNNEISYEVLVKIEEQGRSDIRKIARGVLLQNHSEKIDEDILIKLTKSSITSQRQKAKLLLEAKKLTSKLSIALG